MPLAKIGASPGRLVGEQAAVRRHRVVLHGDRSVGREPVGIKDGSRPIPQALLRVQHGLRLETGVPDVEDPAGFSPRHVGPGVVPQRRKPAADSLAAGDARKQVPCKPVLSLQPRGRARTVRLLEPAVRIGDPGAVVFLHDPFCRTDRISQRLRREPVARNQNCQEQDFDPGGTTPRRNSWSGERRTHRGDGWKMAPLGQVENSSWAGTGAGRGEAPRPRIKGPRSDTETYFPAGTARRRAGRARGPGRERRGHAPLPRS